MNRILLAVDGSDHSERAARVAGELSGGLGLPVDVVNVVSESTWVNVGSMQDYARAEKIAINQRELLQSLGADLVVDAANRVREAGGVVKRTNVLIGAPAQQIAHYAEDEDIDMIVMGRRGLGDLGGMLVGSVSHKVGHLTSRTLVTTE